MFQTLARGLNRLLAPLDCCLSRLSRVRDIAAERDRMRSDLSAAQCDLSAARAELVAAGAALEGERAAQAHARQEILRRTARPRLNADVSVSALHAALADPVNLLLLGSVGDAVLFPHGLADRVRIFSVDAVSPAHGESVVPITSIITPSEGEFTFIERTFAECSSIARPRRDLLDAYGLSEFFQEQRRVVCRGTTLAALAAQHDVGRWHFIKCDLESLDFPVVHSLGDSVRRTLVLQMELRFEPFFEGEPYFHEAAAWLHERGFALLDVRVERWRYRTPHQTLPTRGRATFCNAIFVNRRLADAADALVQSLLVGGLGYVNFAEHILQPWEASYPAAVGELREFLFSAMRDQPPLLPIPELPHVVNAADD